GAVDARGPDLKAGFDLVACIGWLSTRDVASTAPRSWKHVRCRRRLLTGRRFAAPYPPPDRVVSTRRSVRHEGSSASRPTTCRLARNVACTRSDAAFSTPRGDGGRPGGVRARSSGRRDPHLPGGRRFTRHVDDDPPAG